MSSIRSAEKFIEPLPGRPVEPIGFLLGDKDADVELALAREEVHVAGGENLCLENELVKDVHEQDDGRGEVGLEERRDAVPGGH